MEKSFLLELENICKGQVYFNEPLSCHTSFGIGGPADVFIRITNLEQLQKVFKIAKSEGTKFFIVGEGTNVLVSDKGFRGIVLKLDRRFSNLKVSNTSVFVSAGMKLVHLLEVCAQRGLGGLEFVAGIPGSVGGAIKVNAGSEGREIADKVKKIKGIDLTSGDLLIFKRENVAFRYRKAELPPKLLLTEAELEFSQETSKEVRKRIYKYLRKKESLQPLNERSAGCIFKNPSGISAGKLIDQMACKGMRKGGAVVSARHANFIVNRENAKASDVVGLIEEIREIVMRRAGIQLELEVELIGEF